METGFPHRHQEIHQDYFNCQYFQRAKWPVSSHLNVVKAAKVSIWVEFFRNDVLFRCENIDLKQILTGLYPGLLGEFAVKISHPTPKSRYIYIVDTERNRLLIGFPRKNNTHIHVVRNIIHSTSNSINHVEI